MAEPRTIEGAPAPLFDRLSGLSAGFKGSHATRILDRRLLCASVLDELTRLLNTRSSPVPAIAQGARGTVLDYGVPDVSSLAAVSEPDQRFTADAIEKRVAAYEPRLRDVRVSVDRSLSVMGGIGIVLTASLRIGPVYEPVTFPISINRESHRPGLQPAVTADSILG